MSLQITGSIELEGGVEVTSLYARTVPTMVANGESVYAAPSFWLSEQHYLDNKQAVSLQNEPFFLYEYNRTVDGADVLQFSNLKLKESLEALGYTVTVSEL